MVGNISKSVITPCFAQSGVGVADVWFLGVGGCEMRTGERAPSPAGTGAPPRRRGCGGVTTEGSCSSQNCPVCSEQERKQLASSVKRGLF